MACSPLHGSWWKLYYYESPKINNIFLEHIVVVGPWPLPSSSFSACSSSVHSFPWRDTRLNRISRVRLSASLLPQLLWSYTDQGTQSVTHCWNYCHIYMYSRTTLYSVHMIIDKHILQINKDWFLILIKIDKDLIMK